MEIHGEELRDLGLSGCQVKRVFVLAALTQHNVIRLPFLISPLLSFSPFHSELCFSPLSRKKKKKKKRKRKKKKERKKMMMKNKLKKKKKKKNRKRNTK